MLVYLDMYRGKAVLFSAISLLLKISSGCVAAEDDFESSDSAIFFQEDAVVKSFEYPNAFGGVYFYKSAEDAIPYEVVAPVYLDAKFSGSIGLGTPQLHTEVVDETSQTVETWIAKYNLSFSAQAIDPNTLNPIDDSPPTPAFTFSSHIELEDHLIYTQEEKPYGWVWSWTWDIEAEILPAVFCSEQKRDAISAFIPYGYRID
ncbi:MAG: hypothetical protein IPJ88_06440 [Myxococcales bacterium]|nr:MAG: hypothetical protein IPJ88_06440 [Myxococcales bacterium]